MAAFDGVESGHSRGSSGGWIDACGLPHRNSQWAARASVRGKTPLVYVYSFMDTLHSELLAMPTTQRFFDPWHHHNQFLSEWAFHRSLLASMLVTQDPDAADFFYVPFYSRLAYETRKADSHARHTADSARGFQRRMLIALSAGLHASPHWRRSHGRDHLLLVSSTRSMEQLFKEVTPLVAPSILLKVELGDRRRKSDKRMPNHVALPYYVPWLPRDESTRKSDKRYSVCLEASVHSGKVGKSRSQLVKLMRGYPKSLIRSIDPQRLSRSLLCGSRRRMRTCRFCLIPKGMTPSSRRLYEAIAAKCVPVVLSDNFVLPFEGGSSGHIGGSAGSGLLPPHAVDSFVLRVPEAEIPNLPSLLDAAMARHDAMFRSLLAYRTAYLYELPLDGHPAAGGAVCAVIAEVARRFGPHLHAWRVGGGGSGGVWAAVPVAAGAANVSRLGKQRTKFCAVSSQCT